MVIYARGERLFLKEKCTFLKKKAEKARALDKVAPIWIFGIYPLLIVRCFLWLIGLAWRLAD